MAVQGNRVQLNKNTDYGPLEPLFRGVADTALLAEQWDQLLRIAASLRDRTAPAHVVLQRLINASPADRVSKALTALGRACKTIFVLRYIHEEPTRLAIQRQLNRGEARHALARWLFFANRGEFRVGDYEEVMSKASCLGLLSNAAVLWNTVQIERVVGRLRAGGAEIGPADLAHVWPLQHARIIPNGTYFLGWPQDETAAAAPA
jgi:TnpA family transposase